MSIISDLDEFMNKFGLDYKGPPRELPDKISSFRIALHTEELSEYMSAVADNNLEKQLDALVDLVYVTIGTAHLHGFNFQEAWNRIHAANMKKKRSVGTVLEGRGSLYDVVKPEGWEPPFLTDLVRNNDT
jgi:predicted HAD superfamily Cof-like phosphohydrolase